MIGPEPTKVIRRHWYTLPVLIDAIIRDMCIEFSWQVLPEHVCGFIERKPDGAYRIVVNSEHSITRRRFTTAHELGHYIYHRKLLVGGVGDNLAYRAEGTQRPNPNILPLHERQASNFAVNLLMPRHALMDVHGISTETLASQFLVSPAAMRIRLGR